MKSRVTIDAGICGFRTVVAADCADGQFVALDVKTSCEKIAGLAAALSAKGPVDAFGEIDPGRGSVILSALTAKGCCAACAVPVGAYKAMQVAAGLNLPRDISITVEKE